jgi:hypothetical protein
MVRIVTAPAQRQTHNAARQRLEPGLRAAQVRMVQRPAHRRSSPVDYPLQVGIRVARQLVVRHHSG